MKVIDSHTEGEPTRVIVGGGPDLGSGSVSERAARLAREYRDFCNAVVLEPRGSDALVAALLVPPAQPDCSAGVIYFNTVGNLGMCGHASIGTAVTLAHMGRIEPGTHRFETPVGVVTVDLLGPNEASITNIESYRLRKDVVLSVDGLGTITGDIAWGGNWFFITRNLPCALKQSEIPRLLDATQRIRRALWDQGWTGEGGAWIDHIILLGPTDRADARNFVLCPSGSYDRSPCGTGSSALLACLAEDGALRPGDEFLQESIIGSTYRLHYQPAAAGRIVPVIRGRAWVTAESELLFCKGDPYASGIGGALRP